jgi:hypothetical protein
MDSPNRQPDAALLAHCAKKRKISTMSEKKKKAESEGSADARRQACGMNQNKRTRNKQTTNKQTNKQRRNKEKDRKQ